MKSMPVAAVLLTLAACGGGSSSTAPLDAQASTAAPGVLTVPEQGVATPIAAEQVIEPPMVAVPAGSFAWSTAPERTISVPAFQMGKYEVTVAQWRQFVGATGFRSSNPTCWKLGNASSRIVLADHTWNMPSFPQNEFHPVTCVSNVDAKAYLAWLQTMTGKIYRLPSEAEWEHAFRGGQDKPWWGEPGQVCRYANIRDTDGVSQIGPLTGVTGNFPCSDGAVWTSVAGMYAPNPFGLYDILGNLGEMLDDCEHRSYADAPQDGRVWSTACSNIGKMRRGGNYDQFQFPNGGETGHYSADNHSSMEGFRVALSLPQGPTTAGTRAFLADLEKAQAAERARLKPAP